MKIIAFVGMPASGKSEASKVVHDIGIDVISMGDVIREEIKRRGLEPTDANTGAVANDLRDKEGMNAVAKRCIPKIRQSGGNVVVVDGIRGIAEVKLFNEEFGDDFFLIYLDTPLEIRFERVRQRKRSDDDMASLDDLRRRDERETKWGLPEAIEAADITIENTSTLSSLRARIRNMLETLNGNC
jgi:dephospho-CoA kinase